MTVGGPPYTPGQVGSVGPTPPPFPQYPPAGAYGPPHRRRKSVLAGAGIVVAIALGLAALVVSLIGLGRAGTGGQPSAQPTASATESGSTEAADRALCTAIAPLVKENLARGKEFVALGHTGSPERDAGIDPFMKDTLAWVPRIEATINENPQASSFFTRTLQRFVDDRRIYAVSIRPGAESDSDTAAWNDATVALGGPYEVCGDLGIPLW
jgi:hypothetical protein